MKQVWLLLNVSLLSVTVQSFIKFYLVIFYILFGKCFDTETFR